MRRMVQWAVHNSPAMNTLVIAILVMGAGAASMLRNEQFPEFHGDMIVVSVAYPGASPEEVEKGICQKIEEAIRTIDGIKQVRSTAREGIGSVVARLDPRRGDIQDVVNDMRSAVDRIPSFPKLAEKPEFMIPTTGDPVIQVAVIGPEREDAESAWQLRELAEGVYDDLLQLSAVTRIKMLAAPNYQIDVEISESALRKYNLTLRDIALAIRRENVEMPAGRIRTDTSELLLRGTNRRLSGSEIAKLPVLKQQNGVVLRVGDLGEVVDGFEDVALAAYIDGQPAISIQVEKASSEDLLEIASQVRDYVDQKRMPPDYRLAIWYDMSPDVSGRLLTVTRGGVIGLILVFIALSLFLNIRLAFWVSLGIPVSILGACAILYYQGQTLNQLSTFSFVMALGIVVDDAIVIGENIYAHRQRKKSRVQAAVDGTLEVAPAVIASVLTTVIAFIPMMFVSGIMGKFMAIMPLAIISMLLISLFESLFILPCHLAHSKVSHGRGIYSKIRAAIDRSIDFAIYRVYRPVLWWLLERPTVIFSGAAMALLLTFGLIQGGFVPFVLAPSFDGDMVVAGVLFPRGTSLATTDEATRRMEQAIRDVTKEYEADGQDILKLVYRVVGTQLFNNSGSPNSRGAHQGFLLCNLLPASERSGITSQEVIDRWREKVGEIPGAERLIFEGAGLGIGGRPIEFRLLGSNFEQLNAAVEETKKRLASYPGVFDIVDSFGSGKWEMQLKIRDRAEALGITVDDLASTVRAAYYGEEAMRLQRGRHEVKLMVRYPKEERRSLDRFEEIQIRTADGHEIPLPELAERNIKRSASLIERFDQQRAVTVSTNIDSNRANAQEIVSDLQTAYFPGLFQKYPEINVSWGGQQEESVESLRSLGIGFIVAMFGIYLLLTVQFRSYLQPLIILAVIPFGMIGAVLGHLALGLPLTIFTMFGMVALSGVVVNDSIVLMDFINRLRSEGFELRDALIQAGCQRFRPVLLTSITTIAGLLPILVERSIQAEILIPMAVSISFGLSMATVWVLMLVPSLYQFYAKYLQRHSPVAADEIVTSLPQPYSGGMVTAASS